MICMENRDPEFAAEFPAAAADDEEPVVFFSALHKAAELQSMVEVARKAGDSRERRKKHELPARMGGACRRV